jgi:UDP-GlcNAc:undecaprenyl-phosphate GlcNAc-1-phosphate transferase
MSVGWEYALIFLGSTALSFILTPRALAAALRHGFLDRPGGYKSQVSPVPYMGGLAMILAFAIAVALASLALPPENGLGELFAVLALAVALGLVGLVDDLRGLGPWIRLTAEFGAGVAVWALNAGVSFADLEWINFFLTVLWIVGVTNAFNLLDNMDGLSAGVAAIATAGLFFIAAANGQFLVARFAAGLVGCALGFLRHNFHPARIYMGDAGSLFLGFLVAYLGVRLRFDAPSSTTFLVPILVCAVALFDTGVVTVNRLAHGRHVMRGGRDHVSHRLVKLGLTVPTAVTTIYAAGVALSLMAYAVSRSGQSVAYALAAIVGLIAVIAAVLLSRVRVYDD